jgi:hypothetical protein
VSAGRSAAGPQPPQVWRSVLERPGWTGILGQLVHDIEHLTKALGIVEESGRLADRLLLVDDPGGGPK